MDALCASPLTTACAGTGRSGGQRLPSMSAQAGFWVQRGHGARHTGHRRPQDVLFVDLLRLTNSTWYASARCMICPNSSSRFFSEIFLESVTPGDRVLRVKDHGRAADRAAQWAAPGFVHAAHNAMQSARRGVKRIQRRAVNRPARHLRPPVLRRGAAGARARCAPTCWRGIRPPPSWRRAPSRPRRPR